MPHDVFICHSAKDKAVGDAICATLEAKGIRCWIAPRDVLPGTVWAASIESAIAASGALVLVFSGHSNRSPQVLRELERAVAHEVAILPFRIEAVEPAPALSYYIGAVHWLDALAAPLKARVQELGSKLELLLSRDADEGQATAPAVDAPTRASPNPQRIVKGSPRRKRRLLLWTIPAVVLVAAAVYFALNPPGSKGPSHTPTAAPAARWTPADEVSGSLRVIALEGASILQRPERGSEGSRLEPLSILNLLGPDGPVSSSAEEGVRTGGPTTEKFYRASWDLTGSDSAQWVPAEDVIVWPGARALVFADERNRHLAYFFATREDALQALRGAPVDPVARGAISKEAQSPLMPVIASEDVRSDGLSTRLYRTAWPHFEMVRAAGAGDSPGEETGGQPQVDIVFVVDATASMQNPIDQLQAAVGALADHLHGNAALADRVRLGLVAFRDAADTGSDGPDGRGYVTKVCCPLPEGRDLAAFRHSLATLTADGGGDEPEDALAGIRDALDERALGWNQQASRHIIVISDATIRGPDHPIEQAQTNDGNLTLDAVKSMAQPEVPEGMLAIGNGTVLSVIHVLKSRAELADRNGIAEKQYRRLVQGRQYAGFYMQKRGGSNADDFSEDLTAWIVERLTGPPRGDSRDSASVRELWVTEHNAQSQQVFDLRFFVARDDLELARDILSVLTNRLKRAWRGDHPREAMLDAMRATHSLVSLEEATFDVNAELYANYAGAWLLPTRAAVLELTPMRLTSMTSSDFQHWIQLATDSIAKLETTLERADGWLTLPGPGALSREFRYVKLEALP